MTLVIEALPTGVLYAENFAEPPNRISNELWVTSHGYDGTKVQVMFDFTAVSKTDAGANIALVVRSAFTGIRSWDLSRCQITVIIVMILSATLLSNSVSQIVSGCMPICGVPLHCPFLRYWSH